MSGESAEGGHNNYFRWKDKLITSHMTCERVTLENQLQWLPCNDSNMMLGKLITALTDISMSTVNL